MAKLKPGMRMKENGTIEYRFTVNGTRYSVSAKSVKDVLAKEQDARQRIAMNTYVKNDTVTVAQYFDEWIKRRKDVKECTKFNYIGCFNNHLRRSIGHVRIQKLERRQISLIVGVLSDTAPSQAKLARVILHSMLEEAIKDGIVSYNPAAGIKDKKDEKERSQKASETIHRALTREEQAKVQEMLKGTWLEEFFLFLLLTGVRSGEACSLKWSDIDLKDRVIHIQRTSSGHGKMRSETTPKTKTSTRDIPINDDIDDVLRNQRQKLNSLPYTPMDNHVFFSSRLNLLTNMAIYGYLDRQLKKYPGILRFSPHAFRDTFATRYIEAGGNMNNLKNLLGHSSIKITMDLYAHVLPDAKGDEMRRIKII